MERKDTASPWDPWYFPLHTTVWFVIPKKMIYNNLVKISVLGLSVVHGTCILTQQFLYLESQGKCVGDVHGHLQILMKS